MSQPLSKTVVKLGRDTRSEIEHVLADPSSVTKVNVEAIVESRLTKCTSTVESKIVKPV